MKNRTTTAVAIVATLMFCALSASAVSAELPVANAPTWSQGDSWAMGKSVDLDAEFSQQLNQMQQMLENMTGSASLDEFNVQASASTWLKVEVISATADEYVVQGKLAMRFNGEASVRATGEMPAPGVQAWDDTNYPKVARTVSAEITADMAFVSEMTVTFDKFTMAIKSIETTNKASAVGSVKVQNIPETKFNISDMTITHSYRNIDVSLAFDMELNVGATFSPALNLIEFPLSYGSAWSVSSLATITGNVSGFLDIKGLSATDKQSLFENPMLQNAGITDFPIDFSKLSTEGEPKIVNGTLVPSHQYVNATMECTAVDLVDLPLFGWVNVFQISVNGGSEKFYYSDGIRFMTGAGSSLEGLDLPIDLGGVSLPDAAVEMDPVTTQEADQNINAISSYQADLSGQAGNSNADVFGALLGNLPIIGLVVAIVVVLAIVAVFMVKRKKK